MAHEDGTSAAGRRPNPLRALGEQEVLDLILREGPVTRPEIARRTGLSKATISAIVERLQGGEMIRARGPRHGRPGRSPVAYEVRDRAGFVLGIDIAAGRITVQAADIFGEPIAMQEQAAQPTDRRGVSRRVLALADRVVQRGGSTHDRLLAIGISSPGVIDGGGRVTSLAYHVSPDGELDPRRAVAARYRVPVLLDNDVNLAALAESWRGCARGVSTLAFVWVGVGVGMGLLLDGRLVRGAHGAAGEIGYLPSSHDPFDERHRLLGGLEDEIGAAGLLGAYARAGGGPAPDAVTELFARAAGGDATAQVVVGHAARRLGTAIASVLAVIDPALVVLGGEIGEHPALLDPVRETVGQLVPLSARIERSVLGAQAPLYGAVAVALREAWTRLWRQPAS